MELAASSRGWPILSGSTGRWRILLLTRLAFTSLTAITAAPLLRVRLGGEHAGSSNYGKNPQGSLHDVMMVRVRTPPVCPTSPKFVTIRCRASPSLQPVSALSVAVVKL